MVCFHVIGLCCGWLCTRSLLYNARMRFIFDVRVSCMLGLLSCLCMLFMCMLAFCVLVYACAFVRVARLCFRLHMSRLHV